MRNPIFIFFVLATILFTTSCTFEDYSKPSPTQLFDSNKKVIFIGVDGMRADIVNEQMTPFIWSIIQEDQTAYSLNGLNEEMTLSAPNWSSLLTGVHWNKHKVVENDFIGEQLQKWPSIFHKLESTYLDFETASIVHWEPINQKIIRNCVDTEIVSDDEGVRDLSISILENYDHIDLMFLHFDALDAAGHSYGFSPQVPEYAETATSIDEKIQDVVEALRARPFYNSENWLIIITTDHGGEGTSHGNNPFVPTPPNFRKIPMIFNGANVFPGILEGRPNSVDVATTILDYFGLNYDELDGESIAIN